MIVKGDNIEKKRNDTNKIIGGVLSLSIARKKGWHCHQHTIVSIAMVKAADHMKGRVMSLIGVNVLLCMIG